MAPAVVASGGEDAWRIRQRSAGGVGGGRLLSPRTIVVDAERSGSRRWAEQRAFLFSPVVVRAWAWAFSLILILTWALYTLLIGLWIKTMI
nr:hypothetical protein Itr_chr15CG12150 [Ipomoea trifida]